MYNFFFFGGELFIFKFTLVVKELIRLYSEGLKNLQKHAESNHV